MSVTRLTSAPRRALLGPAAFILLSVLTVVLVGIPYQRDALAIWLLVGLLCFSLSDIRGYVRGVILDWLPFLAMLIAYDSLRGSAAHVFATHYLPQLDVDRWLFGGRRRPSGSSSTSGTATSRGGRRDVVRLPHPLLRHPGPRRDPVEGRPRSLPALCGARHRAVVRRSRSPTPCTPRRRPGWPRATDSWPRSRGSSPRCGTASGWAPPARSWRAATSTPTTSPPSRRCTRRSRSSWRSCCGRASTTGCDRSSIAYPLLMAFTLVFAAEHYVFDILLGWGYTAAIVLASRPLWRRYQARRAEREGGRGRRPRAPRAGACRVLRQRLIGRARTVARRCPRALR